MLKMVGCRFHWFIACFVKIQSDRTVQTNSCDNNDSKIYTPQNMRMHSIKTHDSESRGQEESGRTQRTSELFTHSTALKFVNALNKPP